MLTAWGDGDMETFNKMKDEIVKSLAVVGGLLLAVNLVGIIGAMKMIVAGLKIGVPAILGLLANPWTWVVLGIGVAASFEESTSPRETSFLCLFGISIPIALLPGIGASKRTSGVANAYAMS